MKLILLVTSILFSIVCVEGGVHRQVDPDWMLWPGKDGKPQVVFLRGGPEERFDPAQVTFHFYSRSNVEAGVQMTIGDLNGADFEPSRSTKFLVHGFTESGFDPWVRDMKIAFLNADDLNIISVDWERPAQGPFYDNAKQRTKPTGEVIGQFMDYLVTQGGDLGKMHCVGFSLGAHACGFAGKYQNNTSLGRITGLDPALPLFDYDNTGGRLDETDASFVDVVHTCGGWLAFWHPLGHADFYPNNGESSQPGCGLDLTGSCSHGRAHDLYIESIASLDFRSLRCDSWQDFRSGACDNNPGAVMGSHVVSGVSGSFYLQTRGTSPFALG